MAAKTPPKPTTAELFAEAEQKRADARAVWLAAREAHRQAASHKIGSLLARSAHDMSITPADVAGEVWLEPIALQRLRAAKRAYESALNQGPHEPIVANAIGQTVAEFFECETAVLDRWEDLPSEIPGTEYVYLVQTTRTERHEYSGAVRTDRVEVRRHRPSKYAKTDWSALGAALAEAFIDARVHGVNTTTLADGSVVDHGTIMVNDVMPLQVALPHPPSAADGRSATARLTRLVTGRLGTVAYFDERTNGPKAIPTTRLRFEESEVDTTTLNGKVHTTVEGRIVLESVEGRLPDKTGHHVRSALADLVGMRLLGLGTCTKADTGAKGVYVIDRDTVLDLTFVAEFEAELRHHADALPDED